MFLTRIFLDPGSRRVRQDVGNPEGLHKTVMRLFPSGVGPEARKECGVLHRLDASANGLLMLLIQSRCAPDVAKLYPEYLVEDELGTPGLGENPSVRNMEAERSRIEVGDEFFFRLKANTTRKILTKSSAEGKRSNGKRVPVRGEAAREQWLRRHAEKAGFRFADVRVTEAQAQGPTGGVRLGGAIFDGVLDVEDAALFRAALETGIGPAKAYGFGLLSIRRVQ